MTLEDNAMLLKLYIYYFYLFNFIGSATPVDYSWVSQKSILQQPKEPSTHKAEEVMEAYGKQRF